MLAALHVLAALAETDRPLSDLLAEFARYVDTGEINSTVADPGRGGREIEAEYAGRDGVTLDHLDGLTVPTRTGGSMSARPTPSRCCGSTPRPATWRRSTGCATTCSP